MYIYIYIYIYQFFGNARFSTRIARTKPVVQLADLRGAVTLPSGIQGRIPETFCLFCILNSSKQKEHIVGLVHKWPFACF